MSDPSDFIHATVVIVGEAGVLIEGASGSGKSSLADALIVEAARAGCFGCLVGDDRVGIAALNGRLVARPHATLAGLIERRGLGLIGVPHEPACVLDLAVDLAETVERWPDQPQRRVLCGLPLPLLRLRAADASADNARRVLLALPAIAPHCINSF